MESRSIPAALSVLDEFGRFSGYKLNLGKSEMFTVNGEVDDDFASTPKCTI